MTDAIDREFEEEYTQHLEELAAEGRRLLEENVDDPIHWPDDAKLELIALHFDAIDLGMPSPLEFVDPYANEVQTDLRRIAAMLRKHELVNVREALEHCKKELEFCLEAVSGWGAYASPYFQEKWDLDGDVQRIRKAIVAVDAAFPDREGGT